MTSSSSSDFSMSDQSSTIEAANASRTFGYDGDADDEPEPGRVITILRWEDIYEALTIDHEMNALLGIANWFSEDDELHIYLFLRYEFRDGAHYYVKHFMNKRCYEIIADIKQTEMELSERYDPDNHATPIKIVIKKCNPIIPRGGPFEFTIPRLIDDKVYHVYFPKTCSRCIVTSLLVYFGITDVTKHTLYKNYNRWSKNKSMKEILIYISAKLDKNVIEIRSINILDETIRQHKDDIILVRHQQHVGVVLSGISKIEEDTFVTKIDADGKTTLVNAKYELIPKIKNFPGIICAIDCEFEWDVTNENIKKSKRPNLWCLAISKPDVSGIIKKSFSDIDGVLCVLQKLSLNSDKQPIYVYSHNGKAIEHQYISDWLIKSGFYKSEDSNKSFYEYKFSNVIGSKLKSLKYGRISFIDTTMYMNVSLEKLSTEYNLTTTKGHAEWFVNAVERPAAWKEMWYLNKKWDINNKDDVEYCMNDCIILIEFVKKYNEQLITIHSLEESGWYITRASGSAVLKSILFQKYKDIVNNPSQRDVFALSYYGGRCEAFKLGSVSGDLAVTDITSSYPYEMCNGVAGKYRFDGLGSRWLMYAIIRYNQDDQYKLALRYPPLTMLRDGKLLFPNMVSKTLVPIWDAEYDEINKEFPGFLIIEKIICKYTFDEVSFEELVAPLFEYKTRYKNVDKSMYNSTKTSINSLYGVLAMKIWRNVLYTSTDSNKEFAIRHRVSDFTSIAPIDIETYDSNGIMKWLNTGVKENVFNKYILSEKCNVATAFQTASCITMQARLHLWKKIIEISKLGGQVLYSDTDSVYYKNRVAHSNQGSGIGQWETEHLDEIYIKGLKVYKYRVGTEWTCKIKGIKNEDQIKSLDLDWSKDMNIETSGWQTIRENGTTYQINKTFNKNINCVYTKGTVLPNGDVVPLLV